MDEPAPEARVVLIDSHSLIYRAFFALPPMSTSAGVVTNAAFGFMSMLALVLAERPRYVIAAFDTGKPSFRAAEYEAYKATRKPLPEDLKPQFSLVRRILEALGIPVVQAEGFEADDVIGTLSRQAEERGLDVLVVSGDLDCLQLVSEHTRALIPRRGITDTVTYGPEEVRQRYGLEPHQLIEFKALRGDPSDNIPGVPGVGEKTATELLQRYGDLDGILGHLDEMKPGRTRGALEQSRDELPVARRLVTIRRDAPVELDLAAASWFPYDVDRVRRVFDELEFRQLFARLPAVPAERRAPVAASPVRTLTEAALGELERELASGEAALFGLFQGEARHADLAGFGLATAPTTWFVPAGLLAAVRPALARCGLVGHDVKLEQLLLEDEYRWAFSTHLAAYLIGAGARDPRLEDMAREILGVDLKPAQAVFGSGRKAVSLWEVDAPERADYAGSRAAAIRDLAPTLAEQLRALGVDYLFHEVELPLAAVLVAMEREGVAVDTEYLREMGSEMAAQLHQLEEGVYTLAGQRFNLNAPQQLAKVLFQDLGLPGGRRTKTGLSTDAETLEGLRERHPVVPLILEQRQLVKLKSTYLDALPQLVDPTTGRIHTSFGQASTATGRLSSSNPNLMNIPVRTDMGQRIRRAFVAGRADHLLFSADYSQIELRVAAHLSEDPNLLAAFAAGHDIHAATAARVFKTPLDRVDPAQRRLAKIANFGSLYGQGEYGLAQQMGIPGEEARAFLKDYWATYAGLKAWLDQVRSRAREEALVVSVTGRRRAIPDLKSPSYTLRQAAERMAINFPIQSLAADIIKIAMVRLHGEMRERKLAGRMLLQVHDELVFEVPKDEVSVFAEMVPRVMTGAYGLLCGLAVEAKAGPNWADMTAV